MIKMSPEAIQARRDYYNNYRRKNIERIREREAARWERKAKEAKEKKEEEENKD